MTQIGSFIHESGSGMLSVALGGTSNAAIFTLQAPIKLELFKYLNIQFPANFVAYYNSRWPSNTTTTRNLFSLIKKGSDTSIAISGYYQFSFWSTPIVLLERCGRLLNKELVSLLLCFLTWLPVLICKNKDETPKSKIFTKLHYTVRWNLVITFFVGDFSVLILQTMIQFHEVSFQELDAFSILSIVVTILILIAYALIIGFGIYQVNKRRLEIPSYMTSALKQLKKKIEKEKFPESLAVFKKVG